ncbi:hypothetical protein SteCoe_1919 [Stentor coeruleus]|uniref:Uncharacterized protein n=1 Tax=Stentor coeruleus TaxID=5963 RepID=A0A1R2D0Z8_9CILI|nr:hypothetical protein SteCoe_1919 [Stentor coeruleus]
MNINKLSLISKSKSSKIIRVRKKVKPDSNIYKVEDDFALEKQGSVTNFLVSPKAVPVVSSPIYDKNGELNPRSFIGPKKLFATKQVSPTVRPALVKRLSMKTSVQKKSSESVINYQSRFDEALNKIEQAKKNSEQEEKLIYSHLSPREQIIMSRQSNVLSNFQKTQKYWKGLEKGLAAKTKKNQQTLLSSVPYESKKPSDTTEVCNRAYKPHLQDGLLWYMSLRDDPAQMKSEAFLKVGPEFGGLYTRIKGSVLEAEVSTQDYRDESLDFQVIGVGKLPLEIEAVNRVGVEHLDTKFLNLQKYDETIEENYGSKISLTSLKQ